MADIKLYDRAIYNTELDIQYEEFQMNIRRNGICRILEKLNLIDDKTKRKNLLRILSKLLASQYLSESFIKHCNHQLTGLKINRSLLMGEISFEDADIMKKANPKIDDCILVEYQYQLASMLDPTILENPRECKMKIKYIKSLKTKLENNKK